MAARRVPRAHRRLGGPFRVPEDDRAFATREFDDLATEGLLERTPAERGRRRETSLTAAGYARLAAAAPAVVEFERTMTASLTKADRAAANRALQAVLRTALEADGP